MHFSSLVDRLAGKRTDAWQIHYRALEAQAAGQEVFILSVGDPDFATPSRITERAISALRAGDTHYSEVNGRLGLRRAIAQMHSTQTGQAISADQVTVVAGAQNGLFATAQCLCEAGDEVLVPEPMYLTYEASIRASGATLVPVAVHASDGFHLRAEAFARAITPRTRAIFLATPNNPTGAVMHREELAAIAELAQAHDLWIVADEVYAGLTFEQPHLSMASLPGMAARTVTIGSLSKSHAMAGWRVGWIVSPPILATHLERLALCMLYGLPGFIQEAAQLAIEERELIVNAMRETYRRRRDICYALLSKVEGLACSLPEAGMFMLLDVRDSGLSAHDFVWQLFDKTGVAVLDASAFGDSASGFVRLGFVLEEERLSEACSRIVAFSRQLQQQQLGIASGSTV
jgi:arginine:pyruvate transaminase